MFKPVGAMDEPNGIDLRHERFRGEALGAAELNQALLDFADFTGAQLTDANLSSGRLRFAALSGADLESADLFGADLRHARLDHADLRTAKLNDAQLDYADFAGANLAAADLRGQCLSFVRLTGANLSDADLAGADLRHACLRSTDLAGADLRGALLDYANLDGANLVGTDLRGASLRYAKNVDPARIDRSVVDETTVLPFWFEEPLRLKKRYRRFPSVQRMSVAGLCGMAGGAALAFAGVTLDNAIPRTSSVATMPKIASSIHGNAAVPPAAVLGVPAGTTAWVPKPRLLDERPATAPQVSLAAAPQVPLAAVRQVPLATTRQVPLAATQRDVKLEDLQALGAAATTTEIPTPGVWAPPKPPMRLAALVLAGSGRRDIAPAHIDIAVSPRVAPGAVEQSATQIDPVFEWPASTLNSVMPGDAAGPVSGLPVLAALEGPRDALTSRPDSAIEIIATVPKQEPLTVVVSLNRQVLDVYRGTELLESANVSSGKRGHETRTGIYSILQKRRDHRSNLYNGAPMPWMQRLTRTGTALHGGAIPGYPASHGCVRLPHKFAPQLFEMTSIGENVVVAADRVVPKPIQHALLSSLSVAPATDQAEPALDGDPVAKLKRGAPLRILVTRRTERDRAIEVQYLLASMGHLRLQNFTGRIGPETIAAVKAFQKANDLARTGRFDDALIAQVYDAAGKEEPPEGRLFIRQQFSRVLDVPVAFHDTDRVLGTHLFTVARQNPESGAPQWMSITLEGDKPERVLDRIAIPDSVRRVIADFVATGSSLIVADASVNAAILPEGDDFLVWAKHSPQVAAPKATVKQPAVKRKAARKPVRKRAATTSRTRTVKRKVARPPARPRGLFSRW